MCFISTGKEEKSNSITRIARTQIIKPTVREPESPIKIEAGGQLKNVNELIHANNNDKSKNH